MYRRDLRDTDYDDLLADLASVDAAVQAVPGPDDRIAFAKNREDQTDLWLLEDGRQRRLTSEGVTAMRRGRGDVRWFDWSPAGDRIAYVDANGELATVDVGTGATETLTDWEGAGGGVAWGEAGIAVVTDAVSRASLAVVAPDGTGIDVRASDDHLYADPQWDGDSLVAVRARHRDHFDDEAALVRIDADGAVETLFREPGVRVQTPRPRPGGDEIAFVHDGSGFDAIYLLDAATGGEPSELFALAAAEVGAPAWAPDGDRLAATVTDSGRVHVHAVTPDGHAEQLTTGDATYTFPQWRGDSLIAVADAPTAPPAVEDVHTGEGFAPEAPVGFDERLPEPEAFTYESDDREIHAVVYPPAADAEPNSVPLVVKPHGGPTTFDGFEFDYRAAYVAALGYAVVLPNYRGSDGFGRAFRMANDDKWGGGDLDDVVAAADATAAAYDAVDPERVGIFGGSGGGLMTVNALGNSDRFQAGAAFYGVYDYETFVDDTDDVGWRLLKSELGDLATDLDNYREASPIRHVPNIDDPLLVLHGEEDARVPISQSEQLVEQLEAHDKRHEFRRYDGEPHGFCQQDNVVDAYIRVADLFAKYLRRDPDDGGSRPYEPPE